MPTPDMRARTFASSSSLCLASFRACVSAKSLAIAWSAVSVGSRAGGPRERRRPRDRSGVLERFVVVVGEAIGLTG